MDWSRSVRPASAGSTRWAFFHADRVHSCLLLTAASHVAGSATCALTRPEETASGRSPGNRGWVGRLARMIGKFVFIAAFVLMLLVVVVVPGALRR